MDADLDALARQPLRYDPIAPADLPARIAPLGPRWTLAEGELRLVLPAQGMRANGAIAAHAAALADEVNHHPRIVLEYTGLTLTLHTHDAAAITAADVVYAARLEQWLRTQGAGQARS